MKDGKVTIATKSGIEVWNSRAKALDFYCTAAASTDGSESDGYTAICCGLIGDADIVSDGTSYGWLKEHNHYLKFNNPTNTRDHGGKIWYPVRSK